MMNRGLRDGNSKVKNTIFQNSLLNVVDINGLLIPIALIESTFANYTHPLIIWNEEQEVYFWNFMGSCVGIYYRNRYLLLCTRHQLTNGLQGRSAQNVGLLDRDGKMFRSAAGLVTYEDYIKGAESYDLAVFDFTEVCIQTAYIRERFFKVDKSPPPVPFEHIIAVIVSGYPTDKQNHGYEQRKIDFSRATMLCALENRENQSSHSDDIFKLKILNKPDSKMDGISGGGAFVLQLEGVNARGYFAGIVVRGGEKNIYILKVGNILEMIDRSLVEK